MRLTDHLLDLHTAIHATVGVARRALAAPTGFESISMKLAFIVRPSVHGHEMLPDHNTWNPPKPLATAHQRVAQKTWERDLAQAWGEVSDRMRAAIEATHRRAMAVDVRRWTRWTVICHGDSQEFATSMGMAFADPQSTLRVVPSIDVPELGATNPGWERTLRRLALCDGLTVPEANAPSWHVFQPTIHRPTRDFERSGTWRANRAQDALEQCAVFAWPELLDRRDLDAIFVVEDARALHLPPSTLRHEDS